MRNEQLLNAPGEIFNLPTSAAQSLGGARARQRSITLILIVALLAFELFNFDTTRYALSDLLGTISFIGVPWAAILALAFCAIDFAGLAHLFTPERESEEAREIWYLLGAWLLGATMNAVMTWWAVNLTLLNHEFGNEVLSREQILEIVPPFVAVLVWLTRILFIGAFSITSVRLFEDRATAYESAGWAAPRRQASPTPRVLAADSSIAPGARPVAAATSRATPTKRPVARRSPEQSGSGRVRQRPPVPAGGARSPAPASARARTRR
ncbi:MAG: hypothetical protein R3272_12170 [Candidatus Promineifilaceae bacterium]|nr:hypothetical protein [Candidatus Promineifilaceae bacterium]